jgi:hypothetical protein
MHARTLNKADLGESAELISSQVSSSHDTPTSSRGSSPETERPYNGCVAVLLVLGSSSDAALAAEDAMVRRLREMVGNAIAKESSRENAVRLLPRLVVRTAHWEPAWAAAHRAAFPSRAEDGDAICSTPLHTYVAAASAPADGATIAQAVALAASTASLHSDPIRSELSRTLNFVSSYAGIDGLPSSRAHRAVAQALAALADQSGPDASLVVVGQGLGALVAEVHLCALQASSRSILDGSRSTMAVASAGDVAGGMEASQGPAAGASEAGGGPRGGGAADEASTRLAPAVGGGNLLSGPCLTPLARTDTLVSFWTIGSPLPLWLACRAACGTAAPWEVVAAAAPHAPHAPPFPLPHSILSIGGRFNLWHPADPLGYPLAGLPAVAAAVSRASATLGRVSRGAGAQQASPADPLDIELRLGRSPYAQVPVTGLDHLGKGGRKEVLTPLARHLAALLHAVDESRCALPFKGRSLRSEGTLSSTSSFGSSASSAAAPSPGRAAAGAAFDRSLPSPSLPAQAPRLARPATQPGWSDRQKAE